MNQATIRINDKDVPHNTLEWDLRTNRHSTTCGRAWGWIHNAPGEPCWSNAGAFNEKAAQKVVDEHNQWLKEQTPIRVRIVEATAIAQRAQKSVTEAEESLAKRKQALDLALTEVARLESIRDAAAAATQSTPEVTP